MNKILLILFIATSSFASAKTIQIDGGNVTFEAPDEFQALSQEIIDIKYPSNRAPKFVIGNSSASTSIAYDIKPNKIPEHEIDNARKAFSDLFPRMIPGLEWIKNEIITIDGKKWIFLEMTSHAVDTDIHNIMLITGYDNQMLLFNFNSTKEEFKKYENQLRMSIDSISIKTK
jgi:hypothetical protein